ALQLGNKIDSEAARLRKKSTKNRQGNSKSFPALKLPSREQRTQLRQEAFEHLTKAQEIYHRYDDHRGNGNVHITLGYLNLDDGELDRAASQAAAAFRLGAEKKNSALQTPPTKLA